MTGSRNKTPADYRDILSQGLPLVGGQAVNLWALYFVERVRELADLRPFTSFDIDVLLSGSAAARLATQMGWTFQLKKMWELSALEGVLITPDGRKVEVIGSVYGLTAGEVRDHLKKVTIQGFTCTVLSPPALLKGKLACAACLPQAGEEPRQDRKHVQMLLGCVRMYMVDMIAACSQGVVSERDVLDELAFIRDSLVGKHAKQCGVVDQASGVIPWRALEQAKSERLRRYAANRLNLFTS